MKKIRWFTLIQLTALVIIFFVTKTPAAILFPVFIAILVPLRKHVLTKLFTGDELKELDSSVIRLRAHG